MNRESFRPFVRKELRVLGPLWLCLMGITAVSFVVGLPGMSFVLVPIGVTSLGAMSIAHEFRYRTMDVLLAQPISRGVVLRIKLGILAALVLMLAGTVLLTLPADRPAFVVVLLWLAVACALCLAPVLGILSRNEISSVIFTGAIPCALLIAGNITVASLDVPRGEGRDLVFRIVTWGVATACGAGLVLLAVVAPRLQSAAPLSADLHLPGIPFAGRRAVVQGRRQNSWVSMLVRKEVRLQSLPIALAVMFATAWTGLWLSRDTASDSIDVESLATGLAGLYVMLVTMLVASAATAGERQLDVIAGQALLPVGSGRSWWTRLATVLALCALLSGAVVYALEAMMPMVTIDLGGEVWVLYPALVGAALYVSSLVAGTLRGLLLTLGCLAAGMFVTSALQPLTIRLGRQIQNWTFKLFYGASEWIALDLRPGLVALGWWPLLLMAIFVVVLVGYAGQNQRSLEPISVIVRRQLPRLLAWVVVLFVIRGIGVGVLRVSLVGGGNARRETAQPLQVPTTTASPTPPRSR